MVKLTRITKGHGTPRLRPGKLVAEKGVSEGAVWTACLLVSGKAVARAAAHLQSDMFPRPTNQRAKRLLFGNEHATGDGAMTR